MCNFSYNISNEKNLNHDIKYKYHNAEWVNLLFLFSVLNFFFLIYNWNKSFFLLNAIREQSTQKDHRVDSSPATENKFSHSKVFSLSGFSRFLIRELFSFVLSLTRFSVKKAHVWFGCLEKMLLLHACFGSVNITFYQSSN